MHKKDRRSGLNFLLCSYNFNAVCLNALSDLKRQSVICYKHVDVFPGGKCEGHVAPELGRIHKCYALSCSSYCLALNLAFEISAAGKSALNRAYRGAYKGNIYVYGVDKLRGKAARGGERAFVYLSAHNVYQHVLLFQSHQH